MSENVKINVGLSYGIISDPLKVQLKKQGVAFDVKKIEQFEEMKDAINTLRWNDLLSDSVVDKVIGKLHKKIMNHVASANKMKVLKPAKP